MKRLNNVLIGLAAVLSLTGCARFARNKKSKTSSSSETFVEVDNGTFVEKATEAWQNVPYTEATINGSLEVGEQKLTIKDVKLPIKDGTLDMDKAASMIIPSERLLEYSIAASFVQTNAVTIGTQYADYEASSEADVKIKFYVGNGFKVTAKDDRNTATMEFDKYGMLTKVTEKGDDAGNISVIVKYSK